MPRRRAVNLLKDLFKKLVLNAEKANGSGGSAVVMRCAAAKDVMRKLVAMEKILREKQERS